MSKVFIPANYYVGPDPNKRPRAILSPPKYIQEEGVLDQIGRYLELLNRQKFGILASSRGHGAEAARVAESISASGANSVAAVFDGECSLPEIEKHSAALRDQDIDCLIAVGGGKCVDAAKCIASRVGVPVVMVPTLASNDAPCSAVSVLYTEDGVMNGAEFFPDNPALVVVDTEVIAAAPARYLVAGMGDAMATWYEVRVCANNPSAGNIVGARPTMATVAMAELCARTIFEQGEQACVDVEASTVTPAIEDIVEANTLLSGVGFESGGLAGAHAYAQGYTVLPHVEANYLHGEMVAMGVVAQLMMEGDEAEARRVASFFARVGLPITLEQIGMAADQSQNIDAVVAGAQTFEPLANQPFEVTADKLRDAMLAANALGESLVSELGDAAYRKLHA